MQKEISFTINGELHIVRSTSLKIRPEMSLNTYLRDEAEFRDTKYMCREGGCGACIVTTIISHPVNRTKKTIAVNSCLIPILACHGWEITTNHGIGNNQIGYHPIQRALAKFNGSQCGYCSSGMIMNMFSLIRSQDNLTMQDVEDSFGGNLCRCTGYRPIMDAFKSLTCNADQSLKDQIADIEDIKMCSKSNKPCDDKCEFMDSFPLCLYFDNKQSWYKVYSIQNILKLIKQIGTSSYRLVAGNTGQGVYKISPTPQHWIDIRHVTELISYTVTTENLTLGANITITETMEILKKFARKRNFWYFESVYDHLKLIANVPVRNIGTLAGNLSLKHDHHEFQSDVFLLLETVDAQVTIVQENGSEVTMSLSDYIYFNMNKCVMKNIILKPFDKNTNLFKTYKIMPRAQNAHAYVNAGFLIKYKENYTVSSARIIYGGIRPDFIHASNTEKYLIDKCLFDNDVLQAALQQLNNEINPDYVLPDACPEFRKNLARNLFYKFILSTAPQSKMNPKHISGGSLLKRNLISGKQFFQTDRKEFPVTEPVNKIEATIQCSGEALYIDDTPRIPGELFGVLILAEAMPLSIIKYVDISVAMEMPGVKGYVDHKDIPGKNLFTVPRINPTEEILFCEAKVQYNGQPIGIILAETLAQASDASTKIKITYENPADTEKSEYLIKNIIRNKDKSKITNISSIQPAKKGNNTKHIIKGTLSLKGQYHFTMETQQCICVPTENGGYNLYAGTQWMDLTQQSAANALNLPMNKINVIVRRIGGAYGSKIVRATLVSTACAVAAHKFQRAVRLLLSINTNMKAIGKRFPTYAEYEVGVDNNGVIQYLNCDYYQDAGISGRNEDMMSYLAMYMTSGYVSETWKLQGSLVRTDMAGNAYCRAPASSEGIAIIENIMEHISHVTGKTPLEVRQANIDMKSSDVSEILNDTLIWADYDKRLKDIKKFNKENRWMKKGLSVAIMDYHLEIMYPYNVFLTVYAGDGTVSISHGGIEIGQGINTKVAQVCAHELGISMNMIDIKPSNTLTAANNTMTGASITSEGICYATIKACKELLQRLEPIRENMGGNPTWKDLVLKAHQSDIDLRAIQMFNSNSIEKYNIPGACISEVIVDILTGEYVVTRVDLQEDVGRSISPGIDVGQIEGAYVMGLGNYTCENLIYGDQGQLLTNNTWTYKIPGVKDIPADFRVKFKQNSLNPNGVLNSKGTGEPALALSIGIPFAIRNALMSSRKDENSNDDYFISIDGPYTVEYTQMNSSSEYTNFTL